jgi:hypothetical protein
LAEQNEKHKQDQLKKQKEGKGHWKPELASNSEEAVGLPFVTLLLNLKDFGVKLERTCTDKCWNRSQQIEATRARASRNYRRRRRSTQRRNTSRHYCLF